MEIEGHNSTKQNPWVKAMLAGDFEAAWRETDRIEIRRRELERRHCFQWHPDYLLWNGTDWRGKSVVVRCNHGLGDTLQFFRFLPTIATSAQRTVVMVQPALQSLLKSVWSGVEVRNGWLNKGEVEFEPRVEMEIMELAYILRITPSTLSRYPSFLAHAPFAPSKIPLLAADRCRPRIGVLWAASSWDPSRSIPAAQLRSLSRGLDADFYSLQQSLTQAERSEVPQSFYDISPWTAEILDLAIAMQSMDLVITVDGMAAHLAGSLEKPFWLLLKQNCDWRWMASGSRSPWYPSARLFRQHKKGDWESVVQEVNFELQRLTSLGGGRFAT